MDDRRGGVREDSNRLDTVDHGLDRAHALLQGTQDRRCAWMDVSILGGGACEESRNLGGENDRSAVDVLVIHDDMRACGIRP
jgi:hypothetical protein